MGNSSDRFDFIKFNAHLNHSSSLPELQQYSTFKLVMSPSCVGVTSTHLHCPLEPMHKPDTSKEQFNNWQYFRQDSCITFCLLSHVSWHRKLLLWWVTDTENICRVRKWFAIGFEYGLVHCGLFVLQIIWFLLQII